MGVDKRGHWGTRIGFIMAAAGSAIGLGNIWKFPYVAGIHGGGAFVLIYLVCILIIGIPVMIAEFTIGRNTQQNAISAFKKLDGEKTPWVVPGFMGVLAAFIILSYYSVIAGWVFHYTGKALAGHFCHGADPLEVSGMFEGLQKDGAWQLFLHFCFIAVTTFVVMFGVHNGIERAANILMPTLFLMLLGLFIYSFFLEGNKEALEFLFRPDFAGEGKHSEGLTPQGVLEGLGHAFFTMSLGMGAMITYGSYLHHNQKLFTSAFLIAGLDTIIALMAGVVIFSVVFTFGLDASAGPSLIFETLPSLFVKIEAGGIVSSAFFLLVAFAALTSSISILEVVVAYFVDHFDWPRKPVTAAVGFVAFLIGILTALSTNTLAETKLPVKWLFGEDLTFFDTFDKIASNILLPLGGLLIAAFAGWKIKQAVFDKEFTEKERKFLPALKFLQRFVAPVLVGIVFLSGLAFTRPLFYKLGILEKPKAKLQAPAEPLEKNQKQP